MWIDSGSVSTEYESISQPVTNLRRQAIIIPPIIEQKSFVSYLESTSKMEVCSLLNTGSLEDIKNRIVQKYIQ